MEKRLREDAQEAGNKQKTDHHPGQKECAMDLRVMVQYKETEHFQGYLGRTMVIHKGVEKGEVKKDAGKLP